MNRIHSFVKPLKLRTSLKWFIKYTLKIFYEYFFKFYTFMCIFETAFLCIEYPQVENHQINKNSHLRFPISLLALFERYSLVKNIYM